LAHFFDITTFVGKKIQDNLIYKIKLWTPTKK